MNQSRFDQTGGLLGALSGEIAVCTAVDAAMSGCATIVQAAAHQARVWISKIWESGGDGQCGNERALLADSPVLFRRILSKSRSPHKYRFMGAASRPLCVESYVKGTDCTVRSIARYQGLNPVERPHAGSALLRPAGCCNVMCVTTRGTMTCFV